MKIAILIADVRRAKGKSQRQISEATGIAERQLSRYENHHETPSLATLVKVAGALGVNFSDLVEVSDMVDPV